MSHIKKMKAMEAILKHLIFGDQPVWPQISQRRGHNLIQTSFRVADRSRSFTFIRPFLTKKSTLSSLSALLKKFPSKVDGFTFGTNLLMVITSEVKVFMTFWFYYVRRYYLLREVAWHWNLLGNQPSVNIGYFWPSTVYMQIRNMQKVDKTVVSNLEGTCLKGREQNNLPPQYLFEWV